MDYNLIYQKIETLNNQIALLPKGYISQKSIYGKIRYYHQWKEHGKVKSKYIKEGELQSYIDKISERKKLQSELKELELMLPNNLTSLNESFSFETNVITGQRLVRLSASVQKYDHRDCYSELQSYLNSSEAGRVCIIFGLRRTGKTTMLFQSLGDMSAEKLSKTAYIKITKDDTMALLNKDLQKLCNLGYESVFIDEATIMSDFIDSASLFSDVYAAQGMKIVLSGTDSLGMWLTTHQELYDRARTIHTTFIPFKEHSRLLGINSIDDYIRYGGTLRAGELAFDDADVYAKDASFCDNESTRRYIDTAISKNIQHSLAFYENGGHFRNLYSLYLADELTNAINRIIEDMNHSFVKDVIVKEFKSHDLGSAAQLLRKAKDAVQRTDILDNIDTKAVTKELIRLLDIRNNKDCSVAVTDTHVYEIKEYLTALELVKDAPIKSSAPNSSPYSYPLFVQPGMRFCQAQTLVHSLMKDGLFSNSPEVIKNLVTNRIIEDIQGRMLEDIVMLETLNSLEGTSKDVFKLKFAAGEYDMVIYDKKSNTCELYEIKHSKKVTPGQYQHLVDENKLQLTERQYGKITNRYVLYCGKDLITETGIKYCNVEDYLKNLEYPLQPWAQFNLSKISFEERIEDAASIAEQSNNNKRKSGPECPGGR